MKFSRLLFLNLFLFSVVFSQQTRNPKLVISYLSSIGQTGENPGQFLKPAGIAIDPKGNIYIADTDNHRIQKFDQQGKLLFFIGGFGWEREQFQYPVDICANNTLDVFVADYENQRIERYDRDLNWIASIYTDPSLDERLQLGFINSVDYSRHGELFAVDSENKRILKFNTLQEPVSSYGDYDWGQGVLTDPVKICVGPDDMIYVSDRGDGRIFVYDYYGNFLNTIGDEILKSPSGLFLYNTILFVTDTELNKIFAFQTSGQKIFEFGAPGDKIGAFQNPGDIAFYQNKLYVADTDNNRIQIFNLTIQ